jgi:hypothetical protein
MKTLVVGDVHGKFGKFKKLIKGMDLCIQVGDFGYWPGWQSYEELQGFRIPVHFCDGNHENHDLLARASNPLKSNLYYQPRGSILGLPDGRNALFVGGALSVDKHLRTPGHDWFPEETCCFLELPDVQVDVVFSHTCPEAWVPEVLKKVGGTYATDPTGYVLQEVLEKYNPELWYFGHWHVSMEGSWKGTRWKALNELEAVWLM